jgi:hypothetical protein
MWSHVRVTPSDPRIRRRLGAALAVVLLAVTLAAPTTVSAADPVLVGAGDIADCAVTADSQTATLVEGIAGTVIELGDAAYPTGSTADFRDCYDPTWGRFRTRTRPAAGNHEYETAGAAPYFAYFGAAAATPGRGWYAYDKSSWHIVVLNSNCAEIGGCSTTSPQGRWLRADLQAHLGQNVLAYFHHPLFSSGEHGATSDVRPLWELLYAAGADLILNGHEHDYERFAPQDPWGRPDSTYGIRELIVGTGGAPLRGRGVTAANSQVFASVHGVIKLTLHASSYDWSFIPVAGQAFADHGTGKTHGRPPAWYRQVFLASTDAYVDQAHPTTRYGDSTRLRIDGDTGSGLDREAYVKVTVSGLPTGRVVERAALHLWVTSGTVDGPAVYPTSTSWTGATITWATRPGSTGPAASDARRLHAGEWIDLDVTSIVHGNGTYAFRLRSTSADALETSSMQGPGDPRLVVDTVPASP